MLLNRSTRQRYKSVFRRALPPKRDSALCRLIPALWSPHHGLCVVLSVISAPQTWAVEIPAVGDSGYRRSQSSIAGGSCSWCRIRGGAGTSHRYAREHHEQLYPVARRHQLAADTVVRGHPLQRGRGSRRPPALSGPHPGAHHNLAAVTVADGTGLTGARNEETGHAVTTPHAPLYVAELPCGRDQVRLHGVVLPRRLSDRPSKLLFDHTKSFTMNRTSHPDCGVSSALRSGRMMPARVE